MKTLKAKSARKGGSLQRLVRHSWREHDVMYVIGCIDSNGAIAANPSREGRTHRPEESKGKRWRWCVWSQEMAWGIPGRTIEEINNPRMNELNNPEAFAVWDWLRKHDFTDDRSMPNDPMTRNTFDHDPRFDEGGEFYAEANPQP